MAQTTKEASYIILLGILISVLPISSTLLQDGYHVRFKQNSNQKGRKANQTLRISSEQPCPINLLSNGVANVISNFNSDTISKTISEAITDSNPEAISYAISESNSDRSHCSTLLQEGGIRQRLCEAVGEHLSRQYVAQVDLSIPSHICSTIVFCHNVCNHTSSVDPVLDAHDQWMWIGGHVRDSRDAELVLEMRYLCESHAADSKGIVFGIGRGLGSQLLFSRSPVNCSSEGDVQSTCRFIAVRASSIVRIHVTSRCAVSECAFSKDSSGMQTPVLCAVQVPKHELESYHMLIARVIIVPAANSECTCHIEPSGRHHVHQASDHWLVYGWIVGFYLGLPLLKLHRHRHGNWSVLVHSELRQVRPNIAVLMDVDRVMVPNTFDDHTETEGGTAGILHPEPLLNLILDLPNHAVVSNDEEIINVQNDCSDDCALIFQHEQSSVDKWCPESNRHHKAIICAWPFMRRLLEAMKRLSQAEYISKMNFSHRKPPGVSERMWSVNLDASIAGEYETVGGHCCRPSE